MLAQRRVEWIAILQLDELLDLKENVLSLDCHHSRSLQDSRKEGFEDWLEDQPKKPLESSILAGWLVLRDVSGASSRNRYQVEEAELQVSSDETSQGGSGHNIKHFLNPSRR